MSEPAEAAILSRLETHIGNPEAVTANSDQFLDNWQSSLRNRAPKLVTISATALSAWASIHNDVPHGIERAATLTAGVGLMYLANGMKRSLRPPTK